MQGSKHSTRNVVLTLFAFAIFLSLAVPKVQAQRVALKTNALDYLTLSPNLTLETRLSRSLSLQIGVVRNPFHSGFADTRFNNFRVEPELRYYFNRPMARHFMALSATACKYNMRFGGRYYVGDAIGAGISYGYALVLSRHWNMEFELGVGLASIRGYHYRGKDNRPDSPNYNHVLPVPIRCGISFGYKFN